MLYRPTAGASHLTLSLPSPSVFLSQYNQKDPYKTENSGIYHNKGDIAD
jgi:hypothetical protein